MNIGGEPGWSNEYPTKSGWYWFYGKFPPFKFGLRIVWIANHGNSSSESTLAAYYDGRYIYASGMEGVWQRISEPQVPPELRSE